MAGCGSVEYGTVRYVARWCGAIRYCAVGCGAVRRGVLRSVVLGLAGKVLWLWVALFVNKREFK